MTKSKRWDFVGIGDKEEKDGKQKFTGHPIGVGCEGDFTCNTLLYDVMTGVYDCTPCQLSTPTLNLNDNTNFTPNDRVIL